MGTEISIRHNNADMVIAKRYYGGDKAGVCMDVYVTEECFKTLMSRRIRAGGNATGQTLSAFLASMPPRINYLPGECP